MSRCFDVLGKAEPIGSQSEPITFPKVTWDVLLYILRQCASSFSSRELCTLRLVCQNFSRHVSFDNICFREEVVEKKLRRINKLVKDDYYRMFYHACALPIPQVKMILNIKVMFGEIHIPRFAGPLMKNETPKGILNMCLKTLSGLYMYHSGSSLTHVFVDLESWEIVSNEIFCRPSLTQLLLLKPGATCSNKFGLIYCSTWGL
jgi:hypothetical protein